MELTSETQDCQKGPNTPRQEEQSVGPVDSRDVSPTVLRDGNTHETTTAHPGALFKTGRR